MKVTDCKGRELAVGDRVRYSWGSRMDAGEVARFEQGEYGPEVVIHFPGIVGKEAHRGITNAANRVPDLELISERGEESG